MIRRVQVGDPSVALTLRPFTADEMTETRRGGGHDGLRERSGCCCTSGVSRISRCCSAASNAATDQGGFRAFAPTTAPTSRKAAPSSPACLATGTGCGIPSRTLHPYRHAHRPTTAPRARPGRALDRPRPALRPIRLGVHPCELYQARIPHPDARWRASLHDRVRTEGRVAGATGTRSSCSGPATPSRHTAPTRIARTLGPDRFMMREKYIFVYQDVRGRYMSEGEFVNVRPFVPDSIKARNREGDRRGVGHLRHDRLAAEERRRQQRQGRPVGDQLSRLLCLDGRVVDDIRRSSRRRRRRR